MNDLKRKLKHHFIRLYCNPGEVMTQDDWETLGKAIELRFSLVDSLIMDVKRGDLETRQFYDIVGSLSIRRQIEDEIQSYHTHMTDLSKQAEAEEIEREEFEDLVVTVTIAVLILAFLMGSVETVSNMTDAQRLLYDAALVILSLEDYKNLTDLEWAQLNAASAILLNPFFLNDGLSGEQLQLIQEHIDIAIESSKKLSQAIIDGKLDEEERPGSMSARLALWVGTAMLLYNIGLTYREDDPYLIWLYNPLKEHCDDCLRLHGQVHTAAEWKESGWVPRGGMLDCGGWRCGCGLYPGEGPSVGNF